MQTNRAQRTQAAQIALAAAILFDLEDLSSLRRQFPDFMKMCNTAGIETDTEIELLLDDQKETTDKRNSSKNVETEQESKDDSRLQGTITSVSKNKTRMFHK